jgi:hypothetical protein
MRHTRCGANSIRIRPQLVISDSAWYGAGVGIASADPASSVVRAAIAAQEASRIKFKSPLERLGSSTSRADPRPPNRRRMARPRLEVADIFRAHGAAWRKANAGHLRLAQLKVSK